MWTVPAPDNDAGETYATCISRVRNPAMRANMVAIRPQVEAASVFYSERAEEGALHLVPRTADVGAVPAAQLVKTYTNRMAQKDQPGRAIYDELKILPEGDRCPYCDHRNISSLDHVLPKEEYTLLTVAPLNLVGSCSDCNKAKLALFPTSFTDSLLHPYFDDITQERWLSAVIVEQAPAVVVFDVDHIAAYSDELNTRMANQFVLLGLGALYSKQAAREIADIRSNLQRHFASGGAAAVKSELQYQRDSRRDNRVNSWQGAAYAAMAQSDWFCGGGFALE